jgi:hypothetical protein
MLAQIEWERENLSTNVMDLVNTRPNLHRTICGCLVQAMCQWTGVNVGAYFGPTIYGQSSPPKGTRMRTDILQPSLVSPVRLLL